MARARALIFAKHGVTEGSAWPEDKKGQFAAEYMYELAHSPEAKREKHLREIALKYENLLKAKSKAEGLLDRHKSGPLPGNSRLSDRRTKEVRECSSKLYYVELTDHYKWHPADVPLHSIAEMMTDELVHPDALPSILANRRLQRKHRREQRRHRVLVRAPQAVKSIFLEFAHNPLPYVTAVVTALVIVGLMVFQRTLLHIDKLTHHVMFYALVAAGLVVSVYMLAALGDRRENEWKSGLLFAVFLVILTAISVLAEG
jgi:hypothetical protein